MEKMLLHVLTVASFGKWLCFNGLCKKINTRK